MSRFSEEYNTKLKSPSEAVKVLKPDDTVIHGMVISEPPALLGAMSERIRNGELDGLNVYSMIQLEHSLNTYLTDDVLSRINANTWFASHCNRKQVAEGKAHFVPNLFSEIPKLIRENMNTDVVMTTVSPMDKHGYFTFGTSNDYISTAARHTKHLILEVNPQMPRVFGDSSIHISQVDSIVENDLELLNFLPHSPDPESDIIGRIITGQIPDGACIQLGIGAIPSAVCKFIADHKNIGIHTEVMFPELALLIETPAVTGAMKSIHPHKHCFTIAQGNKYLYDFIHDNVSIESYPVDLMNNPYIISQQEKMISINSTMQVDLFGQCGSEFINGHQYSATGGQLDFVKGAYHSKGGKSIIAFVSTAKKGTISKIVPKFESGMIVTVPRAEVHWLATEFGMVNLKGKNNEERALAIINIAHPNFREELFLQAKEMKLIR